VQLDYAAIKEALCQRQAKQKAQYDRRHGVHEHTLLYTNQPVLFQNTDGKWHDGVITAVGPEPRSYQVQTSNGKQLRRNRRFLQAKDYTFTPTPVKDSLPSILSPGRPKTLCQKRVTFSNKVTQIAENTDIDANDHLTHLAPASCAAEARYRQVLAEYAAFATETLSTVPATPVAPPDVPAPSAPDPAHPRAITTSPADVQEAPVTPMASPAPPSAQQPRRRCRKKTNYYRPYMTRAYSRAAAMVDDQPTSDED